MPSFSRLALFAAALPLLAGCYPYNNELATATPDAPVYCYKTLARVACYPVPTPGVGEFVGTQQPVLVQQATELEDGSVIVETVSPAYPPPVIPMPPHP